jgi:hypothetical protein
MSRWAIVTAVAIGFFAWPLSHRALADEALTDTKAKETVGKYLRALQDKDPARMAEVAAVPWLAAGEQVVTDPAQLRKALEQQLASSDRVTAGLAVHEPLRYGDLVKDGSPVVRAVLDKVVEADDRVVMVMCKDPPALRYVLIKAGAGGPRVVGGPHKMAYLVTPNPVPEAAARALGKADTAELYSLDPDPRREKDGGGFHGWKVLGKTEVKGESARKELLGALRRSADENELGPAACFNPRHGLRLTAGGNTVDLVICFECLQVEVYDGADKAKRFLITAGPQPAFDRVLKGAGVPLAGKPEK